MKPKTLRALKGSIKKWKGVADGTGVDRGPDNCPLCKLFWGDDCTGCPVAIKTGQKYCHGSPYDRWLDVATETVRPNVRVAVTAAAKRAARAEVKFLKSLLPEESK